MVMLRVQAEAKSEQVGAKSELVGMKSRWRHIMRGCERSKCVGGCKK